MRIRVMQRAAHTNSVAKGFWEGEEFIDEISRHALGRIIAEKVALIHSEVSEALEEARGDLIEFSRTSDSGKPEGLAIELADVMIRVGDLAEWLKIDLEKAIAEKMTYNATRPRKHGRRF